MTTLYNNFRGSITPATTPPPPPGKPFKVDTGSGTNFAPKSGEVVNTPDKTSFEMKNQNKVAVKFDSGTLTCGHGQCDFISGGSVELFPGQSNETTASIADGTITKSTVTRNGEHESIIFASLLSGPGIVDGHPVTILSGEAELGVKYTGASIGTHGTGDITSGFGVISALFEPRSTAVPEPGTVGLLELGLLGNGVIGLVGMVRRKLKLGT